MNLRALVAAATSMLGACALGYAAFGHPQVPPTTPLPSRLGSLGSLLLPSAGATEQCSSGIRAQYRLFDVVDYDVGGHCAGETTYEEVIYTVRCSDSQAIPENRGGLRCDSPDQDQYGCPGREDLWDAPYDIYGVPPVSVACTMSPPRAEVLCESECVDDPPPPEPCGEDDSDPFGCGGCPVACTGNGAGQGTGANFYKLPLAALGRGFPPSLSVFFFGQWRSSPPLSTIGGPVGIRASHSLGPALEFFPYGLRKNGIERIEAWTEGGTIIPFELQPSGEWIALDGRVATLAKNPDGNCTGTVVMTLGNGDVYTFGEIGGPPCAGAKSEGRIQRIDRPDGEYVEFFPNAEGFVGTVASRLGETVALGYKGEGYGLGFLETVTVPDGTTFTLRYEEATLAEVLVDGETLWSLEFAPEPGGANSALQVVRDANGNVQHAWDFTDLNATRILRECGPGGSDDCSLNDSAIEFDYPSTGQTTVSFLAADGTTEMTTWTYASEFGGERPRVTSRSNGGACPGCGSSSVQRTQWPGHTWPRTETDATGFVTVFEDLTDPGDVNSAYDPLGNPLVVNYGCVSATDCGGARRVTRTYRAGTRVVESETSPSAGGGIVTRSRTFDGASTRVVLDRVQGKTASALDGALSATKTRTVKRTYGGGIGSVEVRRIEGPFDDPDGSGTPPSDAPRTDFAYYGASESDACKTGAIVATDVGRLKSITRWVDSGRSLVTALGNFDAAGRARCIRHPDDTVTELTFDNRGRVTRTIVDSGTGALNLTTTYEYDPAGNLTKIGLPPTGSGFGATYPQYRLEYDDADNLSAVLHGYSYLSLWTTLESVHYTYDQWGSRRTTEYRDASGATVRSEGLELDAFNRVEELARPSGSTTRTTAFGYDAEGNLTGVTDAQGDEVSYGSQADLARYDRFGRLSLVVQQICDHPVTDPDAPCSPHAAEVRYQYDPATRFQEVAVQDTVRGGTIRTRYTTDDWGQVVKVDSPDSGVSTYRYDGSGRLMESQSATGKVFRYEYDRMGRLTRKVNASPVTVSVTDPPHGSVTVDEEGTTIYHPDPDYSGGDAYDYTVDGRNGDTATGTVDVSVNPVNDPPIAQFKMTAGVVGTSVDFVIRAEDVDHCELSFSVVSKPTLGNIDSFAPLACTPEVIPNHDGVRVTYTGEQSGFDEIVFSVSDGEYSSQATVALVVTKSGAALLGVSTEAHSALGLDDSETLDDGACMAAPCALESYSESIGPNSGSFGFARASRGSLAAKSGGTAQTGSTPADASFAAQGSGFFTLPDLEFTSSDPLATEVCTDGMNLTLNGTLAAALAGPDGTITAGVAIRVNIGGTTEFSGTLVTDGVSTIGTDLLEGVLLTENLSLTTPGFCVPTGEPVPLTLELATSVDADLFGADLSADSLSDYSNTFSFPDTGPVFELPPGSTADSESGGIADNVWIAPIQSVAIDVKPGNPENVIPCGNPHALIPVALLTTLEFDALAVDADTVRFEDGAEIHRDPAGRARRHVEDADADGDLDLVFHVRLSETGLTCASHLGSLTGATSSGVLIVGSDLLTMNQGGKP